MAVTLAEKTTAGDGRKARGEASRHAIIEAAIAGIAGQGIADPTAAVMSVALLLNHIGEDAAAARVDAAVADHLATRSAGIFSTREVGERIRARL